MTICHHSPNINSGVQPSHLITKVDMWEACTWDRMPVMTRPD